jgi:hypothetical protein
VRSSISYGLLIAGLGVHVMCASRCAAAFLVNEPFALQAGPNKGAAFLDEVANTSSGLGAWGQKGAFGLQGSQSIYPGGTGGAYVNPPPSIVAMKFGIGPVVDSLNATYGKGNWTIANAKLTMQYTFYSNNANFGGGAGSFTTYLVQNNNWSFSNIGTGSSGTFNGYQAGTDPVYATDATTLGTWSGGQANLGSTTYNWLSPPGVTVGPSATNPSYLSWQTDTSGSNQGLITANLTLDPLLVSDVTSATTANPNVSFYLMPNDNTLGLTIFTGGSPTVPTFSFDVISVPEPIFSGAALLPLAALVLRRRRR